MEDPRAACRNGRPPSTKHDIRRLRLSDRTNLKQTARHMRFYVTEFISWRFRWAKNRAGFLERRHVHAYTISPGIASSIKSCTDSRHVCIFKMGDDETSGVLIGYIFLLVLRVLSTLLSRIVPCHHLCAGKICCTSRSKGSAEGESLLSPCRRAARSSPVLDALWFESWLSGFSDSLWNTFMLRDTKYAATPPK